MLAWMGYAMLAAAALGLMAWLIDFAVAGRLGPRRVLWGGVILASAVGPIVFSVTRGIPTAVVAEDDVGAAPAASGRREPIVSDRALTSAWLATSAVLALWLLASQRRLQRRLRVYPPRIVDGERVLVSSDVGPLVVGMVRPQIVLPEWALAMRERDRRIIVAHEAEHRRAHDPLLAAVALIAVAALPWNLALWWQLRRLRLAIEIDCDRRVVSRHAHDAHAYGMLLLATRERVSRVMPTMAMAMAAMRSGLGRRIEALVDGRPRSAARRLGALAAAVVLAVETVSVPVPRLSLIGAAAVAPAATGAPRASAATPAMPPDPRQASAPSGAADGRPRRSAAVSPSGRDTAGAGTGPMVRVTGSSIRVMLLGPAHTSARSDSSRRQRWLREATAEDRSTRGGSASTVAGRWVTRSVTPNRRLVQSRTAPNRWMLLPIPDSLPPSPP